MKVSVEITPGVKEPYAVIYTAQVTEEIQRMTELLGTGDAPVTAFREEKMVILQPNDIFMVRVEDGDTVLYGAKQQFRSRKRLYELSVQLGKQFMQISRSTLVNLSYLDSIEPGLGGTMLLKLKNGCRDYVSRKYLPDFKRYLGL